MRGASRTPGRTRSSSTCTASLPIRAGRPRRWRPADLELIAAVRAAITIPLAVKLSPYYSAFANFAAAAVDAGADGLVLFNRFYQPDLDLDALEVVPRLELSQPWELRLPVALDRDPATPARPGCVAGGDLGRPLRAPTSVKGLMVGADVVMMTSALLRHGPEHVAAVEAELRDVDGRSTSTTRSTSSAEARARRRPRTRRHSSGPTTWKPSDRGSLRES